MVNILELAKNIHPSHTLSVEELQKRYINIHPTIRRDIEFFIEVYPNTSAPLFLSGQIGSGKTTLLKSLQMDDTAIHYFDISDVSIVDPKNSLEISLVLVYKIFQFLSPSSNFSNIKNMISATRELDYFHDIEMEDILQTIKQLKNDISIESKVIIIDGLDRFLELSDYKTIKSILFDDAFIWKAIGQKIIFVTPLFFTQLRPQLIEYSKTYQADELDKTHITIPVPDPTDISLWKQFVSVRAQIDDLLLTEEQIYALVELSGGLLRSTLTVFRHLLNLMYRNGDDKVQEKYIEQIRNDVKQAVQSVTHRSSLSDLEALKKISIEHLSSIPDSAISLFIKETPLAIFTTKNNIPMCILHPVLDTKLIETEIKMKQIVEKRKADLKQRSVDELDIDEIPF